MIGKVGLHGNQDKPHAVIFKRAADKGRLSRLTPAKIAIALDSVPGMLYDFRKPAPPGSRPLPTRRTPHPWGHPARDSERFAEIGCSSRDLRLTQEPLNPLPENLKAMGGVAAWFHVRRDGFGGRDFPKTGWVTSFLEDSIQGFPRPARNGIRVSQSPLLVQSRRYPGVSCTNGGKVSQVPGLQLLDCYPGQHSLLDAGGAAVVQYRLLELQSILSIFIDQNNDPPVRGHGVIPKAQGVSAKSG